jgi:hypothetical protein
MQRCIDEALGQQRDLGERRVEIREPSEVAPRDASHLDVASAPQCRHRPRLVARGEVEPCRYRLRVERSVVGEARTQRLRVAQQDTEHEVADDDDSPSRLRDRLRQLYFEIREPCGDARVALFERRGEIDGAVQYHGAMQSAV